MPGNNTITASNAVFLLTVGTLYTAQQLQGFGIDDAFVAEAADVAETRVGVDGYGVAGYVPRKVPMMIRFLASAKTGLDIFENWIGAQDQAGEVIYASAIITMPSIGRKYTCYNGALMRVSTMADVRKVLQDREFHIDWLPNGTIPAIAAAPM